MGAAPSEGRDTEAEERGGGDRGGDAGRDGDGEEPDGVGMEVSGGSEDKGVEEEGEEERDGAKGASDWGEVSGLGDEEQRAEGGPDNGTFSAGTSSPLMLLYFMNFSPPSS